MVSAAGSEHARRGTERRDVGVLCVACGGRFPAPAALIGPGSRVRCTLCSNVVVLGVMHRERRRVPNTGRVAGEDLLPLGGGTPDRDSMTRRVLAVCIGLAIVASVVWVLVGGDSADGRAFTTVVEHESF